jgi:hypothetical protein
MEHIILKSNGLKTTTILLYLMILSIRKLGWVQLDYSSFHMMLMVAFCCMQLVDGLGHVQHFVGESRRL